MVAFRYLLPLIVATFLGCGTAHADKRIALVMANSAYKNVPQLSNPANDAALMADMFKRSGFDSVDVKLDLTVAEMRKALREFGGKARDVDAAVIYYVGHGIELDGTNYLVPTDATLETDSDIMDETLPLERVLFAVEPARQLRLVILDACRDSPFAKTMKRTSASRGIGRGLARVEPAGPNTMVAFAAKAGSTASDGDSKNGPFATALADHLPKPGLDLRKAFGFVRDDVLRKTGYKQEPYVYGSLGGDDVPLVPAKPGANGPAPDDPSRRDYELALQVGTRDAWSAFLARYGDGFYAELAKGQLRKIATEEARKAAAENAASAEQEKVRTSAAGARKPDQDKAAAETEAHDVQDKIAALSPPVPPEPSQTDLVKSVQAELHRIGCLAKTADGNWDSASRRSLTLFNKYASTSLDATSATADTLQILRAKPSRVCPLMCDKGYKAEGDSCIKIACKAGFEATEDGCRKVKSEDLAGHETRRRRPIAPHGGCFSYAGRTYC
jgi:caspase domain-containing protein